MKVGGIFVGLFVCFRGRKGEKERKKWAQTRDDTLDLGRHGVRDINKKDKIDLWSRVCAARGVAL